jgi:hypothetical protein
MGDPKREPSTCGDAKGSWFHPTQYIMPSDHTCEARFSYGLSGSISVTHGDDVAASKMIKALSLNNEVLAYERAQILSGIESDIESGEINAINKNEEILSWRTPDVDHQLKSFGHIAARYLEDDPL